MMLICLAVIEDMMREAGLDSILMLTVHDSLVIDALRDELPEIHEIVDLVLNNMPDVFKMVLGEDYDTSWMIVPFAGDSEIGLDYANMKGIPRDCSKLDWEKVLHSR
jgi:DNA polymerase I-like protein with 3'-5' exonuclease and polymerase domains